jgi:uncharacterized protein
LVNASWSRGSARRYVYQRKPLTALAWTMDAAITVLGSAGELSDAEWSALSAGRGFYACAHWHRFLEADPSYDVWYVTARAPDGILLGVMPVYLHAGGPRGGVDRFYDPRVLFAGAEPAPTAATLLLGGRAGYDTPVLVHQGLAAGERAGVQAALIERSRRLADAWGADGVAALYLPSGAAHELAGAFGGGEPLITDADAVIALDGMHSLDDYLRGLSGHRRQRVAREIRDFDESSYRLRTGRLSDWLTVGARLVAELHRRHGHADTPELLELHLAQQAEHLDEYSHVIVCERAGAAVGFLLAYEWEGVWYARAAGAADGLRGSSAALFNVVYYAAIRHALERGIRRYHVGPGSLRTKVLRGAHLEPRWSLVHVDGLEPDAWNDCRLPGWDAELIELGLPPAAADWARAAGVAQTVS